MNRRLCLVLLIDDDEDDFLLTRDMLSRSKENRYSLEWADSYQEGLAAVTTKKYDAVLLDFDLGAHNGIELIHQAKNQGCTAPFIVYTGRGSYEVDVEAMVAGAMDYLSKNDVNPPLLERTLRYAIERRHNEEELRRARDETEELVQKRTQELTQANQRLGYQAQLLENVHDAIIATDLNRMITSWNRAAENVFGWKAQDVIGRRYWDLLGTEFPGKAEEVFAQLKETGIYRAEVFQVREDGRRIIVDLMIAPLRDGAGDILGYVSVSRDISLRRKAEEQVRRQTERTMILGELSHNLAETGYDIKKVLELIARSVANSIGDACVIALVSTDREWLNPVAFHHPIPEAAEFLSKILFGQPARVGEGISGRVAASGEPILIPSIPQQSLHAQVPSQYRSYLEHHGIYSLLIVPLKDHGEIIGTLGVSRDRPGVAYTDDDRNFLQSLADRATLAIANSRLLQDLQDELAERKKVEAELAELQRRLYFGTETERLQLARQLHDGTIQDLYGVVFQFSELREKFQDEKLRSQFMTNYQQLQRITQNLMKIYTDLRPPTLTPFGLEKAIRSHIEQFQSRHPEIDVRLELMPDEQELTEQVRLALFRIFQQALNNVERHSQASQVDVRLKLDVNQVLLEIEDNGIGFELPKRWITLAREEHLGLAGASERAEAIGAHLHVNSKPGEGTLIQVVAPRVKQAEKSHP